MDQATFDAKHAELTEQQANNLPLNWFGANALVKKDDQFDDGTRAVKKSGAAYATVKGFAKLDATIYEQLDTINNQFGLTNATGDQVEAIVADFFDDKLPRFAGETDAAYKSRFVTRLLSPTGTRQGMSDAILRMLGTAPIIKELAEASLTGCWSDWSNAANVYCYGGGGYLTTDTSSGSTVLTSGPLGYGVCGATFQPQTVPFGSNPLAYNTDGSYSANLGPYQAFIDVTQPEPSDPKFKTYSQILALIDTFKPFGTTMWVRVQGPVSTGGIPIL
jgi:hypothetical protein